MLTPKMPLFGTNTRRQEKTGAQTAKEGAGRLDRFGTATKKPGDLVGNIQKYAREEAERKRKKKAEETNKAKSIEPKSDFVDRMTNKVGKDINLPNERGGGPDDPRWKEHNARIEGHKRFLDARETPYLKKKR